MNGDCDLKYAGKDTDGTKWYVCQTHDCEAPSKDAPCANYQEIPYINKEEMMKDDFTEEQVIAIIKLADKWDIPSGQIRNMLNKIYDSNFYDDLEFVDELLSEQNAEYTEVIDDKIKEIADEVRQEMEIE